MALGIPIISTFDGSGVSSAVKEFKQLETTTEKMGFAAQKAAKVAALGFAALAASAAAAGAILYKAAQAAAQDEAAQKQLSASIRASTTATDLQIKGVEEYIDKTQRAKGVADDELRPAFGRLVRATGDVTKAQDLLNLSLDLSASTGKSVEATANAVAKAQEGSFGPLAKLGVGYDAATLKAAGFEKVQGMLEERFSGAATAKANTYEGVMARMRITLSELQESVGYKVLPVLTELGNSFLRISDAVGTDGAAGGIKQLRQEIVNLGTDASGLTNTFGKMYNSFAGFINGMMNALAIPLGVINFLTTGELTYKAPHIPSFDELMKSTGGGSTPAFGSKSQAEAMLGLGAAAPIPSAPASIPTLPPKAVKAPKISKKETSSGGGGYGFAETGFSGVDFSNFTINIDAGLISSPATVGQDIIDAILAAERASGTVFAPA